MEGRGLAKGNLGQQNAPRTQSRISAPSELAQIQQTAKSNKDVKFTALMHHIYRIDTLRFANLRLKRYAAAGVDGERFPAKALLKTVSLPGQNIIGRPRKD